GYGLLRYMHAPTARLLGPVPSPDIFLCNEGVIPDLPPAGGPIELDVDTAMSVRDKAPGLGHPIELRVYRSTSGLYVDWWYDARRVPQRKVESLAEHFPGTLVELVREAMVTGRADDDSVQAVELGLVDLSAE